MRPNLIFLLVIFTLNACSNAGGDTTDQPGGLTFSQDSAEIHIANEATVLLTYRCSEKFPPEGVDPIFRRSAYIHPLRSPGGFILTRIQPPDHYHHYGIWNPWTKTHIGNREIDYWNLGKGEGTVRFVKLLDTKVGDTYQEFSVLHHHIDFGSNVHEQVNMEETWDVKVSEMNRNDRYMVDLDVALKNILEDTIIFDAYRYGGGLGYRATEQWNATNSSILTSEGKQRQEADGTRARWCIVDGKSDVEAGRSGILFLSHIDNREHPEPMRVWPEETNNGELFFEFCPIRLKAWIIEPGKTYHLKYRMIVFDGSVDANEAEAYWQDFVQREDPGKEMNTHR